jgi:hypothetical protein
LLLLGKLASHFLISEIDNCNYADVLLTSPIYNNLD